MVLRALLEQQMTSQERSTPILPVSDQGHYSAVITFWFSECEPKQWFKKNIQFDSMIKDRFYSITEAALFDALKKWEDASESRLALIIILDQFCRNIFRDTPRAFSGDSKALKLSMNFLEEGEMDHYLWSWRYFMLMPMMHSEDLLIQKQALPLFKKYTNDIAYNYAVQHCDIISKFGRFPHRNGILGRTSTSEEVQFLKEPGSSF